MTWVRILSSSRLRRPSRLIPVLMPTEDANRTRIGTLCASKIRERAPLAAVPTRAPPISSRIRPSLGETSPMRVNSGDRAARPRRRLWCRSIRRRAPHRAGSSTRSHRSSSNAKLDPRIAQPSEILISVTRQTLTTAAVSSNPLTR